MNKLLAIIEFAGPMPKHMMNTIVENVRTELEEWITETGPDIACLKARDGAKISIIQMKDGELSEPITVECKQKKDTNKFKWCTIKSSSSPAVVQEKVNDWLQENQDIELIDIKYTANAIEFSAMIFYEFETSKP